MGMPTLKAIHIAKSHEPMLHQNLSKSMAFPTLTDKLYGKTTKAQQCINAIAAKVLKTK